MRKAQIDYMLGRMLRSFSGVSDLNISVDRPLQVESSGQLMKVPIQPDIEKLTPFQTEVFALNLIHNDQRLFKKLLEEGSCDSSYALADARFRVNIFSQRGKYSIVLRKLETRIATLKDLNMPDAFYKMPKEKNGLVLVTGATGSGKSTSLAALLRELNETQSIHIVTLEDPVEFVHRNIKATFNQRELGGDFDTFSSGLRAALRQGPKVILVGEMRDRETVELGMKAAETGHLVVSTLHTIDAGQTINRIVGMFSQEEELQVRQRLAETIRWIVGQRLVPKTGGGRLAIHDILGNNMRTKESILQGECEGKTFYEIQEASQAFGMQTFDQALIAAFEKNLVSKENAELYATHKPVVQRGIDRIKQGRGEKTTEIEGLVLESEAEGAAV
ncbi:MAG: PilT/PilU family type 4a pilus ATPase [Elusimicrobiota bacterium]